MRKNLTYIVAGFCMLNAMQVFGLSLSDFGNPFVDLPRYERWKSDMEGRLNSTFAIMVPEKEQRKWKMQNDKAVIGDINDYAQASWVPVADRNWTEKVTCYFEYLPNKKETGKPEYQSIKEYMDSYKKDSAANDAFEFEFKVVELNAKDVIVEVDRYEAGVSRLTKKSSLLKRAERWILDGNWLIGLKYEMYPSVDEEKGAAWEQLKKTWLERFQRVNFG